MNRLADAASPYLLQHAANPVDWWPWCDEALALARREDRPILLSIGYSACHWCHVMAHESFEDPEIAALMNRLFVNIKVDREERPDLDRVYQTAHQMLTGRPGGWPLTVFLDHRDLMPIFAGTYFPPEPRHGTIAFPDLLQRVAGAWAAQKDEIEAQSHALQEALAGLDRPGPMPHDLHEAPLTQAEAQLAAAYDRRHGGFGEAPKFPHPSNLEFLLGRDGAVARDMAVHSLKAMLLGGLYDQLGGGFFRYSVDRRWEIPHFEKMLYDNGPLVGLLAGAARIVGDPAFARGARQTAAWIRGEMQAPEGGLYATLDADSEGGEGAFYLWTPGEVREILGEAADPDLLSAWGLDRPANFEGRWHLSLDPERLDPERLEAARRRLWQARETRPRPHRDEKILTAWNALAITGLARSARLLGDSEAQSTAEAALEFLHTHLWRDGRLHASWTHGHLGGPGFLDDHVYLIQALLEMLQLRWRTADLLWARQLTDELLARFADPAGGFFLTADDQERLIHRPKPLSDDSTPSGNGVAAQVLLQLGHLLAEPGLIEAAEATLKAAWSAIEAAPHAHASLLLALQDWLEPRERVIVRAPGADLGSWRQALDAAVTKGRSVFLIPAETADLPPGLRDYAPVDGGIAYCCRGTRCLPPVRSLAELSARAGGRSDTRE